MTNAVSGRTPAAKAALEFDWIRELGDDDLRAMVGILDAVATTTGTNGFARPLDAGEIADLAAKLRGGLESGHVHQLIVRAGGEIVGIATLESPSQPTRKHIVEIRRAAFAPHRRGRFLMEAWAEVLRKCRASGWDVIQIDVSEDGPVALWQHMGFRVFGTVSDYARVGARRLEGYFMTYHLPTTAS